MHIDRITAKPQHTVKKVQKVVRWALQVSS